MSAQRVLGAGDDATVLPRGAIRWSIDATWATYNEVYGPGGKLESLGARFSSDSLGAAQLEVLRPLRTTLRALAQQPSAEISLGPARTDFSARVTRSAIAMDFGLTSRVMLTARVPYEHTTSEVVLDVNPQNVLAHRPNLGMNPARAAQSDLASERNRKVVDSLLRVVQEVTTRLDACAGTSSDPVCADQSRARALVDDARAVAAGIATTYGTGADTAQGAAFVPFANSPLQNAINARLVALNESFKSYIPGLAAFDTPAPAQLPVSAAQANAFLTDTLGIAPIDLVERSHLGDIEVGGKVLLIDTFGGLARARAQVGGLGFRISLGGLARLGTGQRERPDDIFDVGTGDGQTDIEGNGALDLVVGRRFWASVVGRVGVQMADELPVRIPDVPRNPFLPAYREQTVSRDLGDYVQLEASPRYVYNDYLSLSGTWSYRRKGEDKFTGSFSAEDLAGQSVTLDAGILNVGTKQTEQRVSGGASFSTLRAYDRGRARIPLELQILHWQTLRGSGYVPKQFSTQIQIRYYTRIFGAPLRPGPRSR